MPSNDIFKPYQLDPRPSYVWRVRHGNTQSTIDGQGNHLAADHSPTAIDALSTSQDALKAAVQDHVQWDQSRPQSSFLSVFNNEKHMWNWALQQHRRHPPIQIYEIDTTYLTAEDDHDNDSNNNRGVLLDMELLVKELGITNQYSQDEMLIVECIPGRAVTGSFGFEGYSSYRETLQSMRTRAVRTKFVDEDDNSDTLVECLDKETKVGEDDQKKGDREEYDPDNPDLVAVDTEQLPSVDTVTRKNDRFPLLVGTCSSCLYNHDSAQGPQIIRKGQYRTVEANGTLLVVSSNHRVAECMGIQLNPTRSDSRPSLPLTATTHPPSVKLKSSKGWPFRLPSGTLNMIYGEMEGIIVAARNSTSRRTTWTDGDVKMVEHLAEGSMVMAKKWHQSMWELKRFTRMNVADPFRAVVLDYGFMNYKDACQRMQLRRVYQEYF
ncbi:hypothetical protein MKZ38_005720 [Zalerion maritima]|uniref:DUF7587 domain-containing protein n=1 Tax=Zalerion maritima TaxID=339359 RepID=A0AAD5RKC4_9PEZI|nr:hypothetical protein MKZ38_005720 [Zalerion maritima]